MENLNKDVKIYFKDGVKFTICNKVAEPKKYSYKDALVDSRSTYLKNSSGYKEEFLEGSEEWMVSEMAGLFDDPVEVSSKYGEDFGW